MYCNLSEAPRQLTEQKEALMCIVDDLHKMCMDAGIDTTRRSIDNTLRNMGGLVGGWVGNIEIEIKSSNRAFKNSNSRHLIFILWYIVNYFGILNRF